MPYRYTLTNLKTLDHVVLTHDPIGWHEGTYTIKRSKEYNGAFHDYTTPMKFHCQGGGKDFIENVYNNEAIDGRIDILVEYDCDGTGVFDVLFNGLINLASYQTDGDYITCNIEKTDLLTKLFSRDEIGVDIETGTSIGGKPITPVGSVLIPMHSQKIFFRCEERMETATIKANNHPATHVVYHQEFMTHRWPVTFNELDDFNPLEFDDWGYPGHSAATSEVPPVFQAIDTNLKYPATFTYKLHFAGKMADTAAAVTRVAESFGLSLRWGPVLNASNSLALFDSGGYVMQNVSEDVLFDTTALTGTITLNEGDSVWINWFHKGYIQVGPYNGDWNLAYHYDTAYFTLEIDSATDSTTAKTAFIHEAFNQITDAIADSDGNFASNFYGRTKSQKLNYAQDGCGSGVVLTNGLNIRQFNKPITCSFKQLFMAMDCIHNIGAGYVDGKIRVEPLSFWYDSTTRIISLPFVNKYQMRDDNSRYINKIEIGYDKWQSEFRGGLDDPNANHEYSTIIASVKNGLKKITRFITSSYTIEFTRRKGSFQKVTEDWRYDNDNFLIATTNKYTGRIIFTPNTVNRIHLLFVKLQQFSIGDSITITNSDHNNGTYTIANITYNIGSTITFIDIVETTLFAESHPAATIQNNTKPLCIPEKYEDSFTQGSGMVQLNTAYNLRLTPRHMLLAHLNVITAGLQKIKGLIKFVKGEGNTALTTTKKDIGCPEDFDGQPLGEADSMEWSDDRAQNIRPLWFPEVYSFEYPLTYEQFKTIKANPYGYVEFYRFEDDKKAGYILNMEYQLKTGMTKFELLRIFAPETVGDENGNYVGDTINEELIAIRG